MKLKEILKESLKNKLGDLTVNGHVIAPNGQRRKVWEGQLIITSKDFPEYFSSDFSLEGSPEHVTGLFSVSFNKELTSLEGGPIKVDGGYSCVECNIESFKGGPKEVGGTFNLDSNNISSLEGAPQKVATLTCQFNKLTSLKNIHKYIHQAEHLYFQNNPIKSHVLGVLKISGLRFFYLDNRAVEDIISKYLPEGDILDCQSELIDAGFKEYAQL